MPIKSIRQKIVDKIDDRFKTISLPNGYETEAGSNVFWWRVHDLATSNLPAIVCRDRLRSEWDGVGSWLRVMTVDLEIHLIPDDTADVVMRQVLSDIEMCIGTDVTWGALAEDTKMLEQEKITIEAHEDTFIALGISMEVEFKTLPWNPRTAS